MMEGKGLGENVFLQDSKLWLECNKFILSAPCKSEEEIQFTECFLGSMEGSKRKTIPAFQELTSQPDSQRSVALTWDGSSELLYPMTLSNAFRKLCDRNGSLTWPAVLVFFLSQIPGKCVDIPHCESLQFAFHRCQPWFEL